MVTHNSSIIGSALGKDIWFYMKVVCLKAGIPAMTMGSLRRALEIENYLEQVANVSSHLGHSVKTAEMHYVIKDSRHSVKATCRILQIAERLAADKEVGFTSLL